METQADREARMKKEDGGEGGTFAEQMAGIAGFITPQQEIELADRQVKLLAETVPQESEMLMVPLRDLFESPTNPRKQWGDMDELTASVRKMGGIVNALTGRRVGKKVEIICGHRRYRAAKTVGIDELRVDIRAFTDNQVLELQAVENIQREDLHEMEESEHYGRMKTAGYTAETIAAKVGKSTAHVNARAKLLDLGPEGRAAFYEGTITASVAVPLARIPGRENQEKALAAITRVPMTVQAQIEILQKEFSRNLKGAPFDLADETLEPEAGSCKACPYNSNNQVSTLHSDFPRIEKQGVCFRTPCFEKKCRAQYQRIAAKAKADGVKVLSASDAADVYKNGSLAYKAPFVEADKIIHDDPKKRTWAQLLKDVEGEDAPSRIICQDSQNPGREVKLFDKKEAFAAARAMGLKWAQAASSSTAKEAKTPEEKKAAQRQREKEKAAGLKQEAVLAVTKLTIPKLVREKWSKKSGLPELRALAGQLFATSKLFEPEDQEVVFSGFEIVKDGKVPSDRAVEQWIEKDATKEELIAFSMVLVCYVKWIDTSDEFEPGFADLAYAAGADLTKGLRSQQETMVLEAEKKKAKA